MPRSTTAVAPLSSRLATAVHPSSSGLLAAAAGELVRRTGEMGEGDVTVVMERVRDAPETLGGLFREHGAIYDTQYRGSRSADAAATRWHKAGWSMRDAAHDLADALAARTR